MSLEAGANLVAEQIKRQEYVEVVAHHDSDGIATGSILCYAMFRAGIRFRFRIRHEITLAEIGKENAYLLCDLGAGIEDLPKDTMVVDHHNPYFKGDYHVNPNLAGIDGDRELSASGVAYILAQLLGDNRDLVGLALLGLIGDGQVLSGKNLEILNEGVGNGIITSNRGLLLPGRDMLERWLMAINPFLDGISGNVTEVNAIIEQSGGKNALNFDQLLSIALLKVMPHVNIDCIDEIYGNTYVMEREVIPDAHTLSSIIDACGKSGHGDIAASLCLRNSYDIDKAWEITKAYRLKVIDAIRAAETYAIHRDEVYETEDTTVLGDLADALICRTTNTNPIAVVANDGWICRISARCPQNINLDLGLIIREIARSCGGSGGGHHKRAGATIPCKQLETFKKDWHKVVAA